MRSWKSIFGVAQALVPIVYCGGLLYYFLGVGGSVQGAEEIGLGPTLVGLGAVGLLFCIPLILKIMRIFRTPRSPGSGGDAPAGDDDDDDDGGAAADAIVARYLAQRSAEAAPNAPAARSSQGGGGPARRPSFGRKNG